MRRPWHALTSVGIGGMVATLFTQPVYAVRVEDIPGPWKYFTSIADLITVLLPNVLLIAGVCLFIIILVMGFRMMQSGGDGDTEGMAKGRQALTYAIGGFVLIFTAYFVIQLVEFLTGVKIFNPDLAS